MMNVLSHARKLVRLNAVAIAVSLLFVLSTFIHVAYADDYPAKPMLTYHPLSKVGMHAASVCILRQTDKELQQPMYDYREQRFAVAGCTPASISNALSMLFGVTDRDDAILLLRDIMYMLSNGHFSTSGCNPSYLYKMNKTDGVPEWDRLHNCNVLDPLLNAYPGDITFIDWQLTPDEMIEKLQKPHQMVIARLSLFENWSWVPELTASLDAAGLGDARIALVQMSVGNDKTFGPFRLSAEGHYVSFYMQANELNTTGTLYMLDSMPRALTEQEQYEGFANQLYPFAAARYDKWIDYDINNYYDVTRINTNTLQLALNYATQDELHALQGEDPQERLTEYLSTMDLFGYGVVIVMLP